MSAKPKKAPAEKPEEKDVAKPADNAATATATAEAPTAASASETVAEDPATSQATPESAAAEAGEASDAKPGDVGAQAAERILGPNPMVNIRGKDLLQVAKGIAVAAIQQPQKLLEHYAHFLQETVTIVQGKSKLRPDRGDRRWWDPAWGKSKLYGGMLQLYLAAVKEVNAYIDDIQPEEDDNARAKFLAALINDALAPSNYLINPTAIRRFLETGGESAVKGISNLIHDVIYNEGWPSQVNKKAFELGKNLALTPGQVVFKNDLIELIHYQPQTDNVRTRPLLVVPPQINKYYVFDLSPEKSVAAFLVEYGIETFVVSWRNPTEQHREWGFDDYIEKLEEALDAVIEITGSPDVNIAGACSGGVTIAMLLGYLQAANKPKVHSCTLLVSIFDARSTKNVLGLFATEEAIEAARRRSYAAGILDGKDMAKVFSLMRPNDLIWNYWVNNYLLGNEPPAFDILYWNCDTTRLPAKLHGELLTMFKFNPLAEGQPLLVRGLPINLKDVKIDLFSVGGVTDHITPWEACYRSIHLFGGKKEFVLSNSGHIQSILNPPGNPKGTYFTSKETPETPAEWRKTAIKREDTWWFYWLHWLRNHSGGQKDAPKELGSAKHFPMYPSPGKYALEP